MSPSRMCSVPM